MVIDTPWGPLPPVKRLIGVVRLPRTDEGDTVRIPDMILKCVGYLAEDYLAEDTCAFGSASVNDYELHGTGFFLAVRSAALGGKAILTVFVTAKHLVEPLKGKVKIGSVFNEVGGTSSYHRIINHWVFHPSDPTADVAICPFPLFAQPGAPDIRCPSTESILTQKRIEENNIGIGDEVFMPGLFTFAPGVKRCVPIVRHGNIAMMPDEQIQIDSGFADAYLVEARSTGGMSGSPVFACRTLYGPKLTDSEGQEDHLRGSGRFFLLGLAYGHWDIKESDLNQTTYEHDRKRGVNMGIGVVVPGYCAFR